ncbi:MAG: hypothetical protein ABEJ95_03045 [Candidatus Nanohalobium sp.]
MSNLDARWGSSVAKRGFNNEEDIADKFRNWEDDSDAQEWLEIMGYDIDSVDSLGVENLSRNIKSDIEVNISSTEGESTEGISIKRAKQSANYNQTDKRWVENYQKKWDMPQEATEALKMFVGREGFKPEQIELEKDDLKDERRLYFDELPEEKQEALKSFLKNNKSTIMRDILKGEPPNQTDWILVTQIYEDETRWTLRSIDNAVEKLTGEFATTRRGNIKLGAITLQRKGGDNGRETAQMLQFKMRPFDLVGDSN